MAKQFDKQTRECPGYHYEIGGWDRLYGITDAIESAYSEEEKALCKDAVKQIEVLIFGNLRPDSHEVFPNSAALISFCKEYLNSNKDNALRIVEARYMNYQGELVKSFKMKVSRVVQFEPDRLA